MLLGSFKFIKAIHFQCKKLKKKNHENQKYHQTHSKVHTRPVWKKIISKSSVSGWRCGPVKESAQ